MPAPRVLLVDAATAAAAAGVMGFALIGFQLVDQAGGEMLATRWPALAIGVALVFFGRLALGASAAGRAGCARRGTRSPPSRSASRPRR